MVNSRQSWIFSCKPMDFPWFPRGFGVTKSILTHYEPRSIAGMVIQQMSSQVLIMLGTPGAMRKRQFNTCFGTEKALVVTIWDLYIHLQSYMYILYIHIHMYLYLHLCKQFWWCLSHQNLWVWQTCHDFFPRKDLVFVQSRHICFCEIRPDQGVASDHPQADHEFMVLAGDRERRRRWVCMGLASRWLMMLHNGL